jgi:hypothetical protein
LTSNYINTTDLVANYATKTDLTSKQDTLTLGNGLEFTTEEHKLQVNGDYIFHTIFEGGIVDNDSEGTVNLSRYINEEAANKYRYFVVDFRIYDFEPEQRGTI